MSQPAPRPTLRVSPIHSLFTAEEWVASVGVWEAELKAGEDASAHLCDRMLDSLLWGARRLTDAGYTFRGFDFTSRELHSVRPLVQSPQGGSPGLVGAHGDGVAPPVHLLEVTLRFIERELPDEEGLVEKVRVVLEKRKEEWGD